MNPLQKIKSLLPVSSRSFHQRTDYLESELSRIEKTILEQMNRRYDDLTALVEEAKRENETFNAQQRIYLEAIHRNEGESHDAARRRLFAGIEPATGKLRLSQEATARLMGILDGICRELGIDYWFAFGTLVATLTRDGFIPWDDDIDICMMREDLERLQKHLEGHPDYQMTVVYDRYALNRQVRFSLTDPKIPCFIDVEPWDWAVDASQEHDDAMRKLRIDLMAEISAPEGFEYWKEFPYLFAPGSGFCAQMFPVDYEGQDPILAAETTSKIQGVFDRYLQEAHERGLLCEKEGAKGMANGLENVYDAPWRCVIWDRDVILPTHRHAYEQYEFLVPNKAEAVAEECYPGYPFLANNLLSCGHFPRSLLDTEDVCKAMKQFVDGE